MPAEQIHTVVRKPMADLEEEIRRKYGIRSALADVAIEQDALVFTFEGQSNAAVSREIMREPSSSRVSEEKVPVRVRRKRRVRNRMKTRGWDVVAKFVNGKGQSTTIYRPFYDALTRKKLKRREAYSAVRDILVANGNHPKPSSIEYFLDNTLEYIDRPTKKEEGKPAPDPGRT
jgi:hypothetical protein